MSDLKGPKSKTISSGQQKVAATEQASEETVRQSSEGSTTSEARKTLFTRASQFLEDEDIRNAPVERKRSFLVSKGLSEEDVSDLLQAEQEDVEHAPEAEVMEDYGIDKKEIPRLRSARRTPNIQEQGSPPVISEDPLRPPKDVPPIITYPEFLIHSHKPPPLITARRLLTSLYLATGAAATVYGTTKYIVGPMIESLTAARHSLNETTSTNLDTLNSKLEGAVSEVPVASLQVDDDGLDDESITSDPARFFNRSTATQTSSHLFHSESSTPSEASLTASPIQIHENCVTEIHSKLAEIQPSDATSLVKSSISDLRKYLDGLHQANSNQNRKMWENSKADEYAKLKAEIRGVKGVLLSARNFPSSAAVR